MYGAGVAVTLLGSGMPIAYMTDVGPSTLPNDIRKRCPPGNAAVHSEGTGSPCTAPGWGHAAWVGKRSESRAGSERYRIAQLVIGEVRVVLCLRSNRRHLPPGDALGGLLIGSNLFLNFSLDRISNGSNLVLNCGLPYRRHLRRALGQLPKGSNLCVQGGIATVGIGFGNLRKHRKRGCNKAPPSRYRHPMRMPKCGTEALVSIAQSTHALEFASPVRGKRFCFTIAADSLATSVHGEQGWRRRL